MGKPNNFVGTVSFYCMLLLHLLRQLSTQICEYKLAKCKSIAFP